MEQDGIADYRQPEPRTSVIARTALGNTVEPFENTGKMLFFNSVSRVIICEMAETFALCIALHMDCNPVTGILDTVLDQIPEYGIKQRSVPLYDQTLVYTVL